MLANDSDPDGDPLSILAISQGSQGSIEILPHGILRYRPAPGALGADSFQYSIGDGHGGTASATVTVTISTLGQPLVESFSPSSGLVGDAVTLTGANLSATTAVHFAGVAAQFTVLSPTQIRAVVPDGVRSGPIAVFSPGGSFTKRVLPVGDRLRGERRSGQPAIRAGEQGVAQVDPGQSRDVEALRDAFLSGLPEGAKAKFVVPPLTVRALHDADVEIAKSMPDGDYPLLVTAASSAAARHHARQRRRRGLQGPRRPPVVCGARDLSGVNSSISVSTLGDDIPGCGVSWAEACATIAQGDRQLQRPCAVLCATGATRPTRRSR